MGKQRGSTKVFGPYQHGAGWRCVVRRAGKSSPTETVGSEEEAGRLKASLTRLIAEQEGRTTAEALADYAAHLASKGNKQASISTTMSRLHAFFACVLAAPLASCTTETAQGLYAARQEAGQAVDTHRNELAEAKTFFRWAVKNGLLKENPLLAVEGFGRRRRGKAQLTVDEARRLVATAIPLAEQGDAGAICVLVLVLLGLRAGECVKLRVRDLDLGGTALLIQAHHHDASHLKSEAARRALLLPLLLRPLLRSLVLVRTEQGVEVERPRDAYLFGEHWRDWPREQVQRLCRLANVPIVTAHGLRGVATTAAMLAGQDPDRVARQLGHVDTGVTFAHYAAPGMQDTLARQHTQHVLLGQQEIPRTTVSDESEEPITNGSSQMIPRNRGPR